MKNLLLSMITFLSLSSAFSTTQIDSLPIAKVTMEIINIDTTQYSFTSNYYISAYKAPMLEGRLLNRYTELLNIQINVENQTITISTLTNVASDFIASFITHFKYSGYEIH